MRFISWYAPIVGLLVLLIGMCATLALVIDVTKSYHAGEHIELSKLVVLIAVIGFALGFGFSYLRDSRRCFDQFLRWLCFLGIVATGLTLVHAATQSSAQKPWFILVGVCMGSYLIGYVIPWIVQSIQAWVEFYESNISG